MNLSCYDYQSYYASATSLYQLRYTKQHRSISWLQSGEQQDHHSEGGYTLGTTNGYANVCDNFSNRVRIFQHQLRWCKPIDLPNAWHCHPWSHAFSTSKNTQWLWRGAWNLKPVCVVWQYISVVFWSLWPVFPCFFFPYPGPLNWHHLLDFCPLDVSYLIVYE